MTTLDDLTGERPLTWVFVGDSIMQAARWTDGARGWVQLLEERVRWQLGRTKDVFINNAVSGATVAELMPLYDHYVTRFAPDVVHVSYGTNESHVSRGPVPVADYAEVLADVADGVLKTGALLVLHTPIDNSEAVDHECLDVSAYADAVRDLAARTGAVLVDHDAAWREQWSTLPPIKWLGDRIHPNAAGHRAMADTTADALGIGRWTPEP